MRHDAGSMSTRRRAPREKDLTSRYLAGGVDDELDRVETKQAFTSKNKNLQQNKMEKTALMRAAEVDADVDVARLPVGEVVQVFSLFCDVELDGKTYLSVVRKTLSKTSDTQIVVGDRVRFRDTGMVNDEGKPEAVIEAVEPRVTLLTRADSFLDHQPKPIVANAQQMLIVASIVQPDVKWGLIDRMIVSARAGGLEPIIALNKIDLTVSAAPGSHAAREFAFATEALAHYTTLGVRSVQTSIETAAGLDELKQILSGKTTVLSGHSGVGKSSLIRAIQPHLDLRIGAISGYTNKGRHTTTSAKRYPLNTGGFVVDTPGVKLFGLWNVTAESLNDHFSDVENNTAPDWRRESYERILASI